MVEYEQGSSPTLYVVFVDQTGAPVSVSGTPQVTVRHFINSPAGANIDLDYTNLTLLSGTISSYYYDYNIPAGADKTTYTVIFSGTYTDGTNAISSDEFQVIPRKFYGRKGGGLVTKVSKDTVWSDSEKERVLGLLEQLTKKTVELKELDKKIGQVTKPFDEFLGNVKEYKKAVEATHVTVTKELTAISNSTKEVKLDESGILKKLDSMGENLLKLGGELRKERLGLVITTVEDLKKDANDLREELSDFKKAFIVSLSEEASWRLKKNEDKLFVKRRV